MAKTKDLQDEDLNARIFRNQDRWSEEFRAGYASGYNAAKRHWKGIAEKQIREKEKERVDVFRTFPYNMIPILEEEDTAADDLQATLPGDQEKEKPYYSPRQMREEMARMLSEREFRVISLRYDEGLSLENTGKILGLTKERIRQIESCAIRKLRRREDHFRMIPEYRVAYLERQVKFLQLQLANCNVDVKEKADEIPIEDLDLSVRSYNCLRNAGISTLAQLAQKKESEIMRMRNLGKKSFLEIRKTLAEHGLRFAPESRKGTQEVL